ncbi:MAG: NADH-quinone oxidoreductase subunit B family protein [Candidatus Thorarchaeota archaeon]|jgi:coenzyme F420-reducing hydrogenase gamma subunit
MMGKKPTVGIFGFTGCAGCQLNILNIEDHLLDLLGLIDITTWVMAKGENAPGPWDIALVEGSIAKNSEIERIKKIRENSVILVAIGACATHGGLSGIRNQRNIEEMKATVYGDKTDHLDVLEQIMPISHYVKVDAELPGCPMDKNEFIAAVQAIAVGKTPHVPNYAVCYECKIRENACLLKEGKFCMGPVTQAGCDALCPSKGAVCEGCRGPVAEVNWGAEFKILKDIGATPEEIKRRFLKYCPSTATMPAFQELTF